ncbi:MAG: sugar-binding domain-containing protein, partial [Chloroflexota bacterium]
MSVVLLVVMSLTAGVLSTASGPNVAPGVVDLAAGWQFRLDPGNVGQARGWFRPGANFQAQRLVRTGESLADQGLPHYAGISWYRRWAEVPQGWKRVVLGFGALDVSCNLYVNSRFAGHFSDKQLGSRAAVVDLTPMVAAGGRALLVFRLKGAGGYGGIKQKVMMGQDESAVMSGFQYGQLLHQQHPEWTLPDWTGSGPRAWTVAGVEGATRKAVIATDGTISPWARSYGISIWLYDPKSRRQIHFPRPTASLRDGSSPMPVFVYREGPWQLREELAAAGPPNQPALTIRLTLEQSPNPASIYAAVRPYTSSGGMAPIDTASFDGHALWVNGHLALSPAPGVAASGGAIAHGDASSYLRSGTLPSQASAR